MTSATFAHPVHGLPVRRTFTAAAQRVLPAAVLVTPDHPWLLRQERPLPKSAIGVIYGHDGVEWVMPQGITRRPYGEWELSQEAAHRTVVPLTAEIVPSPVRSTVRTAAAERARAWRAANRDKVQAQHRLKVQRRKDDRRQLWEAAAASNREV